MNSHIFRRQWAFFISLIFVMNFLGCTPHIEVPQFLTCVFQNTVHTACSVDNQFTNFMPQSNSDELVIQSFSAKTARDKLTIDLLLKGRFWNAADQNIYIFLGEPLKANATVPYSLSADTAYFSDSPYPIRHTLKLPQSVRVRAGVFDPNPEAHYSPQIYIHGSRFADLVGQNTEITFSIKDHHVIIEIPWRKYLKMVEEHNYDSKLHKLAITVATERDYVGFVDQLSAVILLPNGIAKVTRKPTSDDPPSLYPTLNYDSHVFTSIDLNFEKKSSFTIVTKTKSPIEDWSQTNLGYYFLPLPVKKVNNLGDATHSFPLPVQWSYYCGVYSPKRIFCKKSGAPESSNPDLSYDDGYSDRPDLPMPKGIHFESTGNTQSLSLDLKQIQLPGDSFALAITTARDGKPITAIVGLKQK